MTNEAFPRIVITVAFLLQLQRKFKAARAKFCITLRRFFAPLSTRSTYVFGPSCVRQLIDFDLRLCVHFANKQISVN